MKCIYMGTPDFAVPCLERLIEIGANIPCVVTQPDKPVGRKQTLTPPPVKSLALSHGLQVYQPDTLKTDEAYEYLKAFEPDFIVVAAYGKILPKRILEIPKIACVNIHGSLLPRYRGAAPIQRAVIDGEKQTGLTTMLMSEGLDCGDILLTETVNIGENETAGELFDRLAALGPDLLIKTLDGLMKNEITPIKQDDAAATYAAMLSKQEALIDWNRSREEIFNLIRGMNPWPIAFTEVGGRKIKIFSSEKTNDISSEPVGTVFAKDGKIFAVCADGVLRITSLQAEGSKRMSDREYLNGHSL